MSITADLPQFHQCYAADMSGIEKQLSCSKQILLRYALTEQMQAGEESTLELKHLCITAPIHKVRKYTLLKRCTHFVQTPPHVTNEEDLQYQAPTSIHTMQKSKEQYGHTSVFRHGLVAVLLSAFFLNLICFS